MIHTQRKPSDDKKGRFRILEAKAQITSSKTIDTHANQGAIETPVLLGLHLQGINYARWQLTPHTKPLKTPANCQQHGAPPPHLLIRRQESHCHGWDRHEEQTEYQCPLPTVHVADVSRYHAPHGTHEERGAEDEVAEHQIVDPFGGEKYLGYRVAEKAVYPEVVPFEDVAEDSCYGLKVVVRHCLLFVPLEL